MVEIKIIASPIYPQQLILILIFRLNWLNRQGFVLGVVVTLILPFGRIKWGPLQAFKGKQLIYILTLLYDYYILIKNTYIFDWADRVDKVINTAESVAETVETVAKKVENIAEDIANKLPDDGQLKEIVTSVEKFANVTAKDAHFVDSFLLKVLYYWSLSSPSNKFPK